MTFEEKLDLLQQTLQTARELAADLRVEARFAGTMQNQQGILRARAFGRT